MFSAFSSAEKSVSEILLAVLAWFASLLSITVFNVDVGFGIVIALEIGMETFTAFSGVMKRTVL
jgi:hypothetical protein